MSIHNKFELEGMKRVSEAVAVTLKEMQEYAKPGMTTRQLDEWGKHILTKFDAYSAPNLTYGFPGWTCICVNEEFCHGVPSDTTLLQEGDLVNIDVSAELDGFWADNGASFVLGEDIHQRQPLVDTSKEILKEAISVIKEGTRISDVGHLIETRARKKGYTVVKNLAGHGVGRSLHESPDSIFNFKDKYTKERFKNNSVVAIETFISTRSTYAVTQKDGWTMSGDRGGYMAQHEHTIVVTKDKPLILTKENGI